ncbi:aminodeoxychorismate/anthranilate synthase component II [Mesosutterella sp. AGMB02718]|uniref:Aminodeoxychorismate/anthranilate synthase component II n=1 Tax=Mesosutterella faecium TaxID=2925194 RepID=A0ABT7IJZ7_9BURK|nr:aminodeoxychorismate/anthranilate synthase component II [Mesosutterella sp. AGMB02718]MDL2058687.1 aminodeoxychorismate/anthranilate synthase component II [Mesosutterella sp. AGMB02718]
MLVMIDNYDSFTYNLVQYFGKLGQDVRVFRNDETSLEEIERLKPDYLCISPGPSVPKNAGISESAIKYFAGKLPILGVCLGHQAIGEVFGGRISLAGRVMHGKTDVIQHTNEGVFKGLPQGISVARYHSLVIDPHALPPCLQVTATSSDGEIMGVRHKKYDIQGVQFHPESIATEHGMEMLKNFLDVRI